MEKKRKIQIVIGACLMASALVFAYANLTTSNAVAKEQPINKPKTEEEFKAFVEQQKEIQQKRIDSGETKRSTNYGKKVEPLSADELNSIWKGNPKKESK